MNEPTDTPSNTAELSAVTEATAAADATEAAATGLDVERISADLAGVEAALQRLDDGTYWTDEVTGDEIPDHVLAADPVARRVPTE